MSPDMRTFGVPRNDPLNEAQLALYLHQIQADLNMYLTDSPVGVTPKEEPPAMVIGITNE